MTRSLLLLQMVVAAAGRNAVRGAGKDLYEGGEAVQNAAQKREDEDAKGGMRGKVHRS